MQTKIYPFFNVILIIVSVSRTYLSKSIVYEALITILMSVKFVFLITF